MDKDRVTYMPRPHDNELMRVPLITNDELEFMLNAVGGLTKTQVDSVWEIMVRIRGSYERDRSPEHQAGIKGDFEVMKEISGGAMGLAAMREVRDRVDAEFRMAHDQVEELSAQEKEIHRRQQAAVYKRNALSTALSSLRSAIHALEEEDESEA